MTSICNLASTCCHQTTSTLAEGSKTTKAEKTCRLARVTPAAQVTSQAGSNDAANGLAQLSSASIFVPTCDTSDPNWQASKKSIQERNSALFMNELMSDIHFLVGKKEEQMRVPAHKYVLAISSSVFYAMFYGSLAENQKEIEIPDVEPKAFIAMLK